jgi:hypothetical protein
MVCECGFLALALFPLDLQQKGVLLGGLTIKLAVRRRGQTSNLGLRALSGPLQFGQYMKTPAHGPGDDGLKMHSTANLLVVNLLVKPYNQERGESRTILPRSGYQGA